MDGWSHLSIEISSYLQSQHAIILQDLWHAILTS